MGKLVSIIIPTHNSEQFLSSCLKSVLAQSYQNLQIIIVDDNSKDNSRNIVIEYLNRDNRISLFCGEFGSPAQTRNRGISEIKGEYVAFVDSDDIIKSNYIERLLKFSVNYDCDIVQCWFGYMFDNYIEIDERKCKLGKTSDILNREESIEELVRSRKLNDFLWDKLYKKDLVVDNPFDDVIYYEDKLWMHKALSRVNKVGVIYDCLYFYRQNPNSLTGMGNKDMTQLVWAEAERSRFIKENFPSLYALQIKQLWNCWFQICFGNIDEKYKECTEELIKEFGQDFENFMTKDINYKLVSGAPFSVVQFYLRWQNHIQNVLGKRLTRMNLDFLLQ